MFPEVGDTVFFRHPTHSWVVGTVDGVAKSKATCTANDPVRGITGETAAGLLEADLATVLESALEEQPEDLLQLTVLHDASLLRCLYQRYMRDHIYTNIGAIVVAFNPFTFSIPWYKDDQMARYLDEGDRIERNLPHSWAQAHNTYHELVHDRTPQFILVSGESGSGKTEASKMVVKYFAALSLRRGGDAAAGSAECGQRLQQCSPILEAFGNAKTVRNDNSSRFGKFMKIQFSTDGILIGSRTTRYLLEKSRIVTAAQGERVYHSFYLLCRGQYSAEFQLRQDKHYASLVTGATLNNSDFDTADDFAEVVAAMRTVGLTDDEVRATWAVAGGVLGLLNVSFTPKGEASAVNDPQSGLPDAARLWGVPEEELRQELLQSAIVLRGETTHKQHTVAAATDARDALSKALYEALFGWLVVRCNDMCDAGDTGDDWIGLLDIFGFEDFKKNSFEQLCINLANETLQGHYNEYIFAKDMDECRAEGVDTADIVCPDNTPCVQLISSSKNGIIALLDDEASLGSGSDAGFLQQVLAMHSKHPDFVVQRTARTTFAIRHYAGTVTYDVGGFVEKNKDTLKDALKLLLRGSTDPAIAALLPAPVAKKGRGLTVGGGFRQQLSELMAVINGSNPHWIRCVKPHPAKKPRMFDGVQTLNQLESSGVLGTVKIRKVGYPVRIPLAAFAERFAVLPPIRRAAWAMVPPSVALPPSELPRCVKGALEAAGLPHRVMWQLGHTKLFLKAEALTTLERARRDETTAAAARIQAAGRGLFGRRATCRLVFARAAARVVDEFRAYMARHAERRAVLKALRAEQEAVACRVSEDYLQAYCAALDPAARTWFAPYATSVLELEEPGGRAALHAEEERARGAMLGSGALLLLDTSEAWRRRSLEQQEAQLWAELGFQETFLARLTWQQAERRGRLAISSAHINEFTEAKQELSWELLPLHEAHGRALLSAQLSAFYTTAALPLLIEPRRRDLLRCETVARAAVAEAEAERRRLLGLFERRVVWSALLASVEGDEEADRHYLAHVFEARCREDIQRAFGNVEASFRAASLQASLALAERDARRQLFGTYATALEALRGALSSEVVADHLRSLCGREERQRLAIATTAAAELRLLLTRPASAPAASRTVAVPPALLGPRLSIAGDEQQWRRYLADMESRRRAHRLGCEHRLLMIVAAEHRRRLVLSALRRLQVDELMARGAVIQAAMTAAQAARDFLDTVVLQPFKVPPRAAALLDRSVSDLYSSPRAASEVSFRHSLAADHAYSSVRREAMAELYSPFSGDRL